MNGKRSTGSSVNEEQGYTALGSLSMKNRGIWIILVSFLTDVKAYCMQLPWGLDSENLIGKRIQSRFMVFSAEILTGKRIDHVRGVAQKKKENARTTSRRGPQVSEVRPSENRKPPMFHARVWFRAICWQKKGGNNVYMRAYIPQGLHRATRKKL